MSSVNFQPDSASWRHCEGSSAAFDDRSRRRGIARRKIREALAGGAVTSASLPADQPCFSQCALQLSGGRAVAPETWRRRLYCSARR